MDKPYYTCKEWPEPAGLHVRSTLATSCLPAMKDCLADGRQPDPWRSLLGKTGKQGEKQSCRPVTRHARLDIFGIVLVQAQRNGLRRQVPFYITGARLADSRCPCYSVDGDHIETPILLV